MNQVWMPVVRRSTRPAISLIEVLVVASILLLLLAMLVPGLNGAREVSRRLVCANHLHQWGVAVQYYRDDHNDYLPTEGTYRNPDKPYAWFNVLPPYLNAPPYREVEGVGDAIKEFPAMDVWICPSKNQSGAYKSYSGKNQLHYGMNAVLDGMGKTSRSTGYTPDFLDQGSKPIQARRFAKHPHTVLLFDIEENSPNGHPGNVATRFHKDYANVLYVSGGVANFRAADFVTHGDDSAKGVIWDHPGLYWGYLPPVK